MHKGKQAVSNANDEALQGRVREIFTQSASIKTAVAAGDAPVQLAEMAKACAAAIANGGKVMLCGNGGSAADAQHIAAEFLGRLRADRDRDGLPALTLIQDTSTLSACANDYGFAHIFSRTLRALGRKGDVLIGITTSGNSENILEALKTAREIGIATLGFLGGTGGHAASLCDITFIPPKTSDTGRIQESHITAGHALVELTEDILKLSS